MNKSNKMLLVIDTNVLLVSIAPKSKYHWIYQAIISGKISIAVSNEILEEYLEVFSRKYNYEIGNAVIRTLLELENVFFQTIHFHFYLIENDEDDNKFADCAISANAQYLISNDKHFNILKNIDFPVVAVKTIEEFREIYFNECI